MRATLCGLIVAVTGCGRVAFEPETDAGGVVGSLSIGGVNPASGPSTVAIALQIEGTFPLPAPSDVIALVDSTPLADVVWRSPALVEATVPAGLAPGTYDVTVQIGIRAATLTDGYVVVAAALDATR